MSEILERLRERQRGEIEEGLREAEQELAQLEGRREELLELIIAARTWLGEEPPQPEQVRGQGGPPPKRTLHEAMEIVLREHPDGLGGSDIGKEIANRGLYEGEDGQAPSAQQIHARASRYDKLFVRRDGLIVATRTLEAIHERLDELRDVAKDEYGQHGTDPEGWTLDDYLNGIDRLADAIEAAQALPHGTRARWEAEKNARNGFAQPLYFRGRRRLSTGGLGFFPGKRGQKGVDWEPTDLSRTADRIAAEPLRQIYVATASLLH